VLTTLPASTPQTQMAWLGALNQAWWVGGTALGALVGAQMRFPLAGLDFVLAALFAVLVVEQWRSRGDSRPLWIALAAYALASALAPAHALVIAIALCLLAGLFLERAPVEPPTKPRR
jgi:4-azaleucine resistance transporter AzlC